MSISNFFRNFIDQFAVPLESESERAYREQTKQRPSLTDDAFYQTFYAGTEIPKEIPIRLRNLYQKMLGYDLSTLRPEDNQAVIYDDVDFADFIYRVEREFGVTIPIIRGHISEQFGVIDGTFDSVVRHLHQALQKRQQTSGWSRMATFLGTLRNRPSDPGRDGIKTWRV